MRDDFILEYSGREKPGKQKETVKKKTVKKKTVPVQPTRGKPAQAELKQIRQKNPAFGIFHGGSQRRGFVCKFGKRGKICNLFGKSASVIMRTEKFFLCCRTRRIGNEKKKADDFSRACGGHDCGAGRGLRKYGRECRYRSNCVREFDVRCGELCAFWDRESERGIFRNGRQREHRCRSRQYGSIRGDGRFIRSFCGAERTDSTAAASQDHNRQECL